MAEEEAPPEEAPPEEEAQALEGDMDLSGDPGENIMGLLKQQMQ